MKVTDFLWNSRGVFAKPRNPFISIPHYQQHPPAGDFAIMVTAAITDRIPIHDYRHFTCAVEVEAEENKSGVQDAIEALLIRECLARWEAA